MRAERAGQAGTTFQTLQMTWALPELFILGPAVVWDLLSWGDPGAKNLLAPFAAMLLAHINLASPTLSLTPFKAVPEIAGLDFEAFNAKGLLSRSWARLSHISAEAHRQREGQVHRPAIPGSAGITFCLLQQNFKTDKCF